MARILIHDFGGYAFPFELARYWAGRGHTVSCRYFVDVAEARGNPAAAAGLDVVAIAAPGYRKYSFLSKPLADRRYGRQLARLVEAGSFDAVISSDTPLDAQAVLQSACRRAGARFIYWLQDVISTGIGVALEARGVPALARAAIAALYSAKEGRLLRASDAVVLAAPAFARRAAALGAALERTTVIENWCPLADVPCRPRENAWAEAHSLVGRPVVLYAGTLGLKHDPRPLAELAAATPHALFVVVGEGPGAAQLKALAEAHRLGNLHLLPFQPYPQLPDVLASADILLALNDGRAARFCYPSKLLTYFCAGRAVFGLLEPASYAAALLEQAQAGVHQPVGPSAADALQSLLADNPARQAFGHNGRAYAERHFAIEAVGPRFDAILDRCLKMPFARGRQSC